MVETLTLNEIMKVWWWNIDDVVNASALLVILASGLRILVFANAPRIRLVGLGFFLAGGAVSLVRVTLLGQTFGPGQILMNCAAAFLLASENVIDMRDHWSVREGRWFRRDE